MKQKAVKHILSFCLVSCLLFLTACGTVGSTLGGWFRAKDGNEYVVHIETPGRMTEFELVQSLVLAVNDDAPVESIFQSIPLKQRNKVSLSSFSRYVSLIRRVVRTDILGFTVLNAESKAKYANQSLAQSDEIATLSSNSIFFHLNFLDESRRESTYTIAVQKNEDGLAYLSPTWLDAVLSMYDFIELYFAAIDQEDVPALKALLKQGELMPLTRVMDKALENKAKETITFYNRRVITAPLEYKLIGLLPSTASIEHYATVSLGSGRRENRSVAFSNVNGAISVLDNVPSELDRLDLDIYYEDTKLFRLGSEEDMASSQVFEPLLGIALSHDSRNCHIVNGVSIFQYRYRGITVSGKGTCDGHISWQGTITSTSLSYSQFRLGSGLAVGMPVSELYVIYPFAKESNYVISGMFDEKQVSLTVQIEHNYITKLTLTVTP